jgi:molybdate transport system permease protein
LTSHAKEPFLDFWQLSSEEWSAVWLSLRVACVATLATLPVAVALGYGLARRQFWGKSLLETVLNLPLVLPPVVVGYLLLVEFGRNGWLGSRLVDWFGIRFVFDWKGAVAASAVMAFPLVVRSIRVAMATIDPRLEEAARTLGCGRFETFLRITVPFGAPRHHCRRGARLCSQHRRIRRDHHDRRQHSRADANNSAENL